jgi:glycosyltransferase involved in cell wall biosynthesis
MRLLLVTRGFPPRVGGVETLCRQLAEGFADRGADVLVVTYGGPGGYAEEPGPFRVVRLPSRGGQFEWSARIVPLLRRLRPDVCHVHNLHSSVAAAVWAARRRPYVLTTHYHGRGHTPAARLIHPVYRSVAARVVRSAAAVTAVSQDEARLVRAHFGVTPEVIPNGVDPGPPGAGPEAARTPDADGRPPTIAVVSRLVRYKRVHAVVHALAELPGFRLHILGDGPERADTLRLAARLGVADRVWLTTERLPDREVRAVVRDAAVHVNLSAAEAFSYTVLEALAVGTPVVTSGDTALAAWSRRFPGAVLAADPADPEQVAAAVRRLAGGRVEVDLGEYALPAILDRYETVYRAVAGTPAGRAAR